MLERKKFAQMIDDLVRRYGGYVNAHAHLDRAHTLDDDYLEHYGITPLQMANAPLPVKQVAVGELHKGRAYQERTNLEGRMRVASQHMAREGVRSCISFIDATPDIGLLAVEAALNVRRQCHEEICLQIAAHPIFGFKDDPSYPKSRWEVFREACEIADVIGGLPEKDDRPDSIGADEHFRRILDLGKELRKPVHVHVDQDNDSRQEQTLDLIQFVRGIRSPDCSKEGEPTVWAVHCISPSAYSEEKFRRVLDGLSTYNIGVICCPRAARSMRQNRALQAPTHNSIARVLEMALAGIWVRLGTDNLGDMFVPTEASMLEEVVSLADELRFYAPQVLAKFAAGIPLNESDKEMIRRHLREDLKAYRTVDPSYKFCIPLD